MDKAEAQQKIIRDTIIISSILCDYLSLEKVQEVTLLILKDLYREDD